MTNQANLLPAVCCLLVLAVQPVRAQWIEPPGTGWVNVQLEHQQTRTGFAADGRVVPLSDVFDDAQSVTTTLRISAAVGVVRGVDVWADVPVHRQEWNPGAARNAGDPLLNTGVGDVRLYARTGPSLLGLGDALPVALAVRGGVKLATGDFTVDARSISLSEGQRDWEVLLEVGKSLHPLPAYVMVWGGRRWRQTNTTLARPRDPGDEWLLYTAAGGSFDAIRWKVALDGHWGAPARRDVPGGTLVLPRRQLVQLIPTVGYALGPGVVRAGARLPVHGQSTPANRLPAGPTFTLGYFLSWDL